MRQYLNSSLALIIQLELDDNTLAKIVMSLLDLGWLSAAIDTAKDTQKALDLVCSDHLAIPTLKEEET